MILLDTSGLLSAIDRSQRHHEAARRALEMAPPPWILSPFVLAELDYLLATRVSQDAERALLAEVGRGVYRLEAFDATDIEAAERVIGRYRELEIGLADASVVVLANRYGVRDLLTLGRASLPNAARPGRPAVPAASRGRRLTAPHGEVVGTDGPYLEAKEYIGGLWVLEAADRDEALEWGRKAALACRVSVEVRPFN